MDYLGLRQCDSMYREQGVSGTWCIRARCHLGDHRGNGRQWTAAGECVSSPTITLKQVEQELWVGK